MDYSKQIKPIKEVGKMALTKEDLYAIGELLEIKLKAELQPVKDRKSVV